MSNIQQSCCLLRAYGQKQTYQSITDSTFSGMKLYSLLTSSPATHLLSIVFLITWVYTHVLMIQKLPQPPRPQPKKMEFDDCIGSNKPFAHLQFRIRFVFGRSHMHANYVS